MARSDPSDDVILVGVGYGGSVALRATEMGANVAVVESAGSVPSEPRR